jgi:hypothetical protein
MLTDFVYQKVLIPTFNTSFTIQNNLCEFHKTHYNSKGYCIQKLDLNAGF